MKNRILVGVLFMIGLSFFSCDNENNENDDFIYPLSIGNTWEYIRNWNQYFYSDTLTVSPEYEDTLTYSSDISVTVTEKVFLNDTLETIEMIGVENDSTNSYAQKHYYKNNDDGLYTYAYIAGGPIVLPRRQQGNSIIFKGIEFDDFRQLSDFVQRLTPNYRVVSDSVHFEEPPVKTLQYPIEIGDQWTYREDNNPWRMDRKVIERKDVELDIGTFDCYEIKFIYDMDHNGEWDDDIWITDFISKKGLIQRTITIIGMIKMNDSGVIRYIDAFDTYTLTDLSVD